MQWRQYLLVWVTFNHERLPVIEIKKAPLSPSHYLINDRLPEDQGDGHDSGQHGQQRDGVDHAFAALDLGTVADLVSG